MYDERLIFPVEGWGFDDLAPEFQNIEHLFLDFNR